MVNPENIAKAAERREARKRARENAVEQAHEQQAGLSDTVAEAKAEAAERVAAPAGPKLSSRERRAKEREAAERKAEKQAREIKAGKVDVDGYLSKRHPGRIPLHVLNARASAVNEEVRDSSREIANAAARAAFSVASGRRDPTKNLDRHARVRDAQARMDAAKAATAKAE